MSSVLRLFVAAFLTDASLYLAFAALPFRAMELGAGSTGLGILPTLYAVAYMATASLAGRWSDRVPRLALARTGGALFLVGCFLLSRAPSLISLDLALPILGLGLLAIWLANTAYRLVQATAIIFYWHRGGWAKIEV